jgi:hypothetical protein
MAQSAAIPFPSSARTLPAAVSIPWPLWAGAASISSIIFGLYWDISWHITIGRDSFWTPAHLAIQFGAVLAALSCCALILGATFGRDAGARQASVKVWGFRGPFGAFLAAWGGATMIVSAPFDNWWHDSFGLDVQIVSPPHMVLATGIFFVGIGSLVLMAAPKNRAAGMARIKLERLFVYIGGMLLTLYMILLLEFTYPAAMHRAAAYKVLCYGTPMLLVALARGSHLRWAATRAAALYFGLCVLGVWIFPLFPAEPKLGPVLTRVTHMIPLQFPLLLFVPALAVDWLVDRWAGRNKWLLALAAGTAFLAVFVAVQWPFASFMVSPLTRNWIFGMNYFGYQDAPSTYHLTREFQKEAAPVFWQNMATAVVAAFLSSRFGLACGDWLRNLQR